MKSFRRNSSYEYQHTQDTNNEGYVSVRIEEAIEPLVIDAVQQLLKEGIKPKDMALLVHTNKDAKVLQELLQQAFPTLHIRLEATLRLVDVPMIKAIIFLFLKYLYFGDELYKTQFLSLCGMRPDTPVLRHSWDISMAPLMIVQKVIKTYTLFDARKDVLSFLEVASRYQDMEHFYLHLKILVMKQKAKMSMVYVF